MARDFTLLVLAIIPTAALAAGPIDGHLGVDAYGGPGGVMSAGDPCDKGTIFPALKVVRAYRDNEVFAFRHLEGKELQISGRLVGIKRDKINVEGRPPFEGFVALVTPDGKAPKPIGLEFRFPLEKLRADPQLGCDLAELYPGQFVTFRGLCTEKIDEGAYQAVIFNDSKLAN